MILPLTHVVCTIGIVECPFTVASTLHPLPLVAVVQLLRGCVLECLVRLGFWRQPCMRSFAVRLVVLPIAGVGLYLALVVPRHRALASHVTILPLTAVGIATGPSLLALSMFLAILPRAFVEGRAIGIKSELPLTMALAH